ncbi:uncharacterized [Tachysurus ichikawai]
MQQLRLASDEPMIDLHKSFSFANVSRELMARMQSERLNMTALGFPAPDEYSPALIYLPVTGYQNKFVSVAALRFDWSSFTHKDAPYYSFTVAREGWRDGSSITPAEQRAYGPDGVMERSEQNVILSSSLRDCHHEEQPSRCKSRSAADQTVFASSVPKGALLRKV